MKKIGVYGGSFNPITHGHLIVIAELLNTGYVDEVWVAPCSARPDKPHMIDAFQRLTMCSLAVDTFFGSSAPVFVTDVDAYTSEYKGAYALLKEVEKMQRGSESEIFFVIGADILEEMPAWIDKEKILNEFKLLLLPRAGYEMDSYEEHPHIYVVNNKEIEFARTNISSSEVRRRLAMKGKNNYGLLPSVVMAHIIRYGLYGVGTQSLQ
jgi:nicotinate (nicotinamide) nucleotide adenylyltransferase